jgi:hypothetical protein
MTARVAGRVRCFLQRQRSPTTHRLTRRSAIGRQKNRGRLVLQARRRQQARHQPTACLCRDHPTGGRDGSFDHCSRNGAHSRTFDGEAREGRAPDRPIARLKAARCGRSISIACICLHIDFGQPAPAPRDVRRCGLNRKSKLQSRFFSALPAPLARPPVCAIVAHAAKG